MFINNFICFTYFDFYFLQIICDHNKEISLKNKEIKSKFYLKNKKTNP